MKRIKFKDLQEPALSEEILELLQDNIEDADNELKGEVLIENSSYLTSDFRIEGKFSNYRKIDIIHGNWERKGEKATTVYEPAGKNLILETSFSIGPTSIRTGVNDITINENQINFNRNFFYDFNGYSQETAVSGIWKIIGYK